MMQSKDVIDKFSCDQPLFDYFETTIITKSNQSHVPLVATALFLYLPIALNNSMKIMLFTQTKNHVFIIYRVSSWISSWPPAGAMAWQPPD